MKTVWFKGIKGVEAKGKREREIVSYTSAFDARKEILEEETSTPDYDWPSWAHKQADQNGYNRAIRKVISIITIKED